MNPTPPEQHSSHVDEMTCLMYLEGQLERARALEVSAHVEECQACRTLFRALERESRLLTRAMLEEDEPLPQSLLSFQQRAHHSLRWIWTLVLGLATAGVYVLYSGYIEPMEQQFQQAGFGGSSLFSLLIFQGAFWKGWQTMLTSVEVLALLMIAVVAGTFLRRRQRRGSAMALVLAGLCAAMMMAPASQAIETRKATMVEITKEETINGDLFASGERTSIAGTVDGDAYVFSSEVNVDGHIKGDLIAFAHVIHVTGKIDGNIRGAFHELGLSGSVDKNITAFGQVVRVDRDGKVGGSMTVFAGVLSVEGEVGKDILVKAGAISLAGKIGGNVRASGGAMSIESTAVIDGPVRFEGEKEPTVSKEAKLASPVEYSKPKHEEYSLRGSVVWTCVWAAGFILFGMILFLVLPDFSRECVRAAEEVGAPLGLGLLVFCALPLAAAIACITLVGLLLGISTFFAWLVSLWASQIVAGAAIGQWMLGRSEERWPLIGRMALGVLLIRLMGLIPFIGAFVKFAAILLGIGAISLAIYRRFHRPGAGAVLPTPVAAAYPV